MQQDLMRGHGVLKAAEAVEEQVRLLIVELMLTRGAHPDVEGRIAQIRSGLEGLEELAVPFVDEARGAQAQQAMLEARAVREGDESLEDLVVSRLAQLDADDERLLGELAGFAEPLGHVRLIRPAASA